MIGDDQMPARISPYALLSASKPKTASSTPSPYDLYSRAQEQANDIPHTMQPIPEPVMNPPIPVPAKKRTHYISDINTRHSMAAGRAAFTGTPIP